MGGARGLARLEQALLVAPGLLLLIAAALLVDAAAHGAFLRTRLSPWTVAAGLSLLALVSLPVRRRVLWRTRLLLALLVVAVACSASWAHRRHVAQLRAAAEGPARAALLGRPAPPLDWVFAFNLTPELAASIRNPRGHYLLVDFWATWCGPCLEHMPRLQALYEGRDASQLTIVGVTTFYAGDLTPAGVNAELSRMRRFVEEHGIHYPIVVTADTSVHDKYHVDSLPTSVLVGRDGNVLDLGIGVVGTREVFERVRRLVD